MNKKMLQKESQNEKLHELRKYPQPVDADRALVMYTKMKPFLRKVGAMYTDDYAFKSASGEWLRLVWVKPRTVGREMPTFQEFCRAYKLEPKDGLAARA